VPNHQLFAVPYTFLMMCTSTFFHSESFGFLHLIGAAERPSGRLPIFQPPARLPERS